LAITTPSSLTKLRCRTAAIGSSQLTVWLSSTRLVPAGRSLAVRFRAKSYIGGRTHSVVIDSSLDRPPFGPVTARLSDRPAGRPPAQPEGKHSPYTSTHTTSTTGGHMRVSRLPASAHRPINKRYDTPGPPALHCRPTHHDQYIPSRSCIPTAFVRSNICFA